MLNELAIRACVVVSEDFPRFFPPHMISTAAKQIELRLDNDLVQVHSRYFWRGSRHRREMVSLPVQTVVDDELEGQVVDMPVTNDDKPFQGLQRIVPMNHLHRPFRLGDPTGK